MILQINKFYFLKGGSEVYLFALEKELRRMGYILAQFSMHDANNKPSDYSEYFVNNIDYDNAGQIEKIDAAIKIIYSFEARRKLATLLDIHKIDLAHLHIFQHQISASILPALKQRGIPIVYTAHDLKSICPNYKMLTHDGVCERCKGGRYYNCFIHKCTKNSRLKSLLNVMEMYFHDAMGWYDLIDVIVTPSDFYRRKMVELRFPSSKVVHIPNFIDETNFEPCYDSGNYFLYFGRLSDEKGVSTLIRAMREVKACRLVVAGTGPAQTKIEAVIDEYGLNNVDLVGFKSGKDLVNLIRGAMFTVLPSEWYENGSISLLESMAYGKPVVGADIGGIPEHINGGEDGLIFDSGNERDLAEKINTLIAEPDTCVAMGKAARHKVETTYSKRRHMEALLNIYQRCLSPQ
jgi:glycosyltransferase involved in cell wall biosynthesis